MSTEAFTHRGALASAIGTLPVCHSIHVVYGRSTSTPPTAASCGMRSGVEEVFVHVVRADEALVEAGWPL